MNTIPIFFAFDNRMLMPAGVCISSLLENAEEKTFYDIFILFHEGDLDQTKLEPLSAVYPNCHITFRPIGDAFQGAYEIRGISIATYYKLLAADFIPEYDKILYSDVDVIFREDLTRYYDLDLGDNYFGAVDNCSILRQDVRDSIRTRLGLDWKNGYYYAGNLVVNSKKIREDKISEEFLKLGKNNYKQQDMDIMNIVCNKRISPIGPSFCLTVQLYDLIINNYDAMSSIYGKEELEHALRQGIVHYNGAKPWDSICPNMDIWWAYYRKSIFYDDRFTHVFWSDKSNLLDRLSLIKRIKLLGRYFIR